LANADFRSGDACSAWSRVMDLAWLEDFEALTETRNFSRAAERRHVTQPAFSRRIRALEDWAGAALFERAEQPVKLTEAGERIRPLLGAALQRLREAREEASALGGAGGVIRFAATHALSFSFFPGWLASIAASDPAPAIHLISDSLEACERLMTARRADLLIAHSHPAAEPRLPDGYRRLTIGTDRLLLVANAGSDARPLPLLAYAPSSGLGRIVAATAAEPERAPIFTSHLAAALRTMVRKEQGVAWLPNSLIAGDLADGSLVVVGAEPIPLDIVIVRPPGVLGRASETLWLRIEDGACAGGSRDACPGAGGD
jgi:DNA-binding transcriptional LysR family regulator